MLMNKTTSNAVKVLVACAQAGENMVKVANLAEGLDLTQQNTFKIVHLLSRAGFVSATRGRNGGVTLARPASEIRVGEVVRSMEYPDSGDTSQQAGEFQDKVLSRLEKEALEAFISVLNQTTIEEMAASSGPKRNKVARKATSVGRQQKTQELAVSDQQANRRRSAPRGASNADR